MKNNDITELEPVNINETSYSSNNDISLVDLAMVLVRHKRMVAVITSFIIALGLAAALLIPKSYTFSTSIEIGSQIINGAIKPFESPQTLLAKIRHAFIPQVLNEQRKTTPEDETKYKVTTNIPKSSVIIVLQIQGTDGEADILKTLLKNITQKTIFDHNRIYNSVKKNIASRLKQKITELQILKNTDDNETEIATQQNLIEIYTSQLANLRQTREISSAMKSIEPTGTSKKLIIIVITFVGVLLGVLSAFFAEFIVKLKETIKQNKTSRLLKQNL